MDNSWKNSSAGGEITIFLTLMLLILLSFFATAVESARMSALEAFGERNLRLAVQSVFSEYCRPLWDQYHLFMLEGDSAETRLPSEFEKYQSEISGSFFKQEENMFNLASETPFLEEGGEAFLHQIKEYMKYHLADDYFSDEKSKAEEMEKVKADAEEQIEQLEEAEEKAEADQSLLKIIRLVEGAVIKNGKAVPESCFIKQICPQNINAYEVGIQNQVIWEAMKEEYLCYDEVSAGKCRKIIGLIDQALSEIEQLEAKETGGGTAGNESLYRQIIAMKPTLYSNRLVLEKYLQEKQEEDSVFILQSYQIRGLKFDYGDLYLKKTENPVETLKKSFGSNLISLVVEDEEAISAKKLPAPFLLLPTNQKERDFCREAMSDMESDDSKKVKKCFSLFSDKSAGNEVLEAALEVAYYQEHFANYNSKDEGQLHYEQEYIIAGGETEREALEMVLDKLLLERGMFNFMYLLTDKEKGEKAHLTALALVGFSGMEALVQIVKISILLGWAMAEAVIDLAILLQGKKLPLWKTKESFLLDYEELFSFGKPLVMKKAGNFSGAAGVGNSYEDYLRGLLYIEKQEERINRSLALIEHNIKLSYFEDFSLQEGIIGVFVEASYCYAKNKTIHTAVNYSY